MRKSGELWAIHTGGCHCGRVQFEVEAPAEIKALECNCSICGKSGFLHLIVPKSNFKLLQGSEFLSSYSFNTGVAKHLFCNVCSIESFYIPRSNPDGYSVNVRCLNPETINKITIGSFDGRHGEKSAASLAHLSKENS
ncbi:MAG: GFA family protein [Deltaproteobacteria bacterium]|nr:GFA family protein [Deltaproteobacteria bacterium]